MKLKVSYQQNPQHKDVCTSVGWNTSNELYSIGDDKTIYKWSTTGDLKNKVSTIEKFVTNMRWQPTTTSKFGASSEIFIVSCSDGSFQLMNVNGRIEKTVKEAHLGAIVSIEWNHDGRSVATGGEDGVVKIWSRGGQMRTKLASSGKCVYDLAWGPESDHILYTYGKELIIKSTESSSKQVQWKAHDAPVLKVDWNPLTGLIVSGGEDGRYKVWDEYGRNLFTSIPFEYAVTSVSWAPDGEIFAAGCYNTLKLCDKTGWSYNQETVETGSIFDIQWTKDGTQLGAAGGNGAVCFGQLIDRTIEWKHIVVSLMDDEPMRVQNIAKNTIDELDFRDQVLKMELGFNYLVVATSTQCLIYNVDQLSTPHVFDIKDKPNFILLAPKSFAIVDDMNGIQIFSYDGHLLSNPKYGGLRTEVLNHQCVSLSSDMIAIIDKGQSKSKAIRIFDSHSGRQVCEPLLHNMEISDVALNYFGNGENRQLVFVDRNRDLYITNVKRNGMVTPVKISTMVDSVKWNDETDMLVAISDGKLIVWYYPGIVYVDRDLLDKIKTVKNYELGKKSCIVDFYGVRARVRRYNGAVIVCPVSHYPAILYKLVHDGEWERTNQICRFAKDQSLWACLAGMAIKHGELKIAENCLAALEEVEKLDYILYIQRLPSVEARNAELALYQRRPEEAESILLQANLIFRAINMHIHLYNWNRALDLAVDYNQHLDTVIAFRKQYVIAFYNGEENNQDFLAYSDYKFDWTEVRRKVQEEMESERARAGK